MGIFVRIEVGCDIFSIGNAPFYIENRAVPIENAPFSIRNGSFCIRNEAFPIKNDSFCIGNGAFPIQNGLFSIKNKPNRRDSSCYCGEGDDAFYIDTDNRQ